MSLGAHRRRRHHTSHHRNDDCNREADASPTRVAMATIEVGEMKNKTDRIEFSQTTPLGIISTGGDELPMTRGTPPPRNGKRKRQ